MRTKVSSRPALRQSRPGDNPHVATALALLRQAISETTWSHEALAEAMEMDRSLVTRILNGERPMTLHFLCTLPDDIEARYERKRAEYFGAIVVEAVNDGEARRLLAVGLFNLLAPRQAKADLKPAAAARVERAS